METQILYVGVARLGRLDICVPNIKALNEDTLLRIDLETVCTFSTSGIMWRHGGLKITSMCIDSVRLG